MSRRARSGRSRRPEKARATLPPRSSGTAGRAAADRAAPLPAPVPAGDERLLPADLEALEQLRRSRQALGETVRSSRDYWSGVRQVLQMRATLQQAEGRFRELYDFIPVPFLVLDHALHVVSANAAANALVGRESRLPLGLALSSLLDASCYREVSAALAAGAPPRPIEGLLRTVRGKVPVQVTAQSADQPADGPRAANRMHYLTILDMSQVRRLEQERQALELEQRRSQVAERLARESNEAKDEFIAMLSHELRTPLTPILAATAALDPQQLPAPVCAAVAAIRRNVLAEARLIDDLLDVQRIRQRRLSIARRPLRLHELLAQVAEDWRPDAAGHALQLELALDAGHDLVNGDPGRLAQVFRNLLGNAAKFTDKGGHVRLKTASDDGGISVSIQDDGAGMTAEQLRALFRPFAERRRPGDTRSGLGLGLVISRGIVDAHGGHIEAYSPGPGLGTSVQVRLATMEEAETLPAVPTVRAPAPAHAEPPPAGDVERSPAVAPAASAAPGTRVLVVEDHADSAETLSMVLSMKGYQVRIARNLAEARRLAPACELLISDISLPDGSGLDLMRELRRRHPIAGIALSGFGTEDDVRRSREAGFQEHLVKPVDVDDLLAAIARLAGQLSQRG